MTPLSIIALSMGGMGLITGIWALRSPQTAQPFFQDFPRNEKIGRVLMAIDIIWSLVLFHKMDLGAWNSIKPVVYFLSPVLYWYIIRYVNHYLGARSFGLLLILMAKPVVRFGFLALDDHPSSVITTALAYVWVLLGMCFIAAPHWLRDGIAYMKANSSRWSWGCRIKIAFSLCLVALGLFVYG